MSPRFIVAFLTCFAFATLAALGAPGISRAVAVVRGPYLQCGTSSSVIVRWRTDVAASTRVRWGAQPPPIAQRVRSRLRGGALTASAFDPSLTTEHSIAISGLEPGSVYWYAIGSVDSMYAADATCRYVTPPVAGTVHPVRAWILGDSGEPGPTQNAVRDAFVAYTGERGADLMLMLGDNAYSSGTDAEYQAGLFSPYAMQLRQWVLWPTRGNHDGVRSGANNDYYEFFSLPMAAECGGVASGTEAYYSFEWANVHFVCLDSEGSANAPNSAMITWLRADLSATDQDWVIAFWHHPPYSKGSHDSDSETKLVLMRQNVVPVLDQLGADVVLSGHSHSYERSFLLRSHYGSSGTLVDSMKVDAGDGRRQGSGPYLKSWQRQRPYSGAVFVVAGSSAKTSGGSLNHPVMVSSQDVPGSLVLDVNGEALDMRFLDATGAVTDSFTVLKGHLVAVGGAPTPGDGFVFLGAYPSPAHGAVDLSYRLPQPGRARVGIYAEDGRRIVRVADGEEPAGERRLRWDGRDAHGRRVAAGVYFAVIEFAGERRAGRIVLTP